MRHGAAAAFVRLEALEGPRRILVEIEVPPPRRDTVQVNRQPLRRSSDLVEAIRVTVFTPDDLALVKGGPAERRHYLDSVLESAHPRLDAVRQQLERVLRQRNTLLRQAGGRAGAEVSATLDVWDAQLAVSGSALVEARERLVKDLEPHAAASFSKLTGISERLALRYERSFTGSLAEALAASRAEDLRRGVTGVGPQRDELVVTLADLDARSRLSQGRQRVVTLALRLASHAVVEELTGVRPVLLLDDAFSELDEPTAAALASQLPPGQAVLTTAGPLPPGLDAGRAVTLAAGILST